MPGRQAHGGVLSKKPKVRINSKKRTLDAYAIATRRNPDKLKIRPHRLGASEGGNRPGKRLRPEEDLNSEEPESSTKKKRKGSEKGQFDEVDFDEGSDSEGHKWKLGQVDSDDDSDLDSDEAFGESDEEKFEGFAFSRSSDKNLKRQSLHHGDVSLDEEDGLGDSDSELEDDDLGEDAVDLATMLDASDSEEETNNMGKDQQNYNSEEGGESDEESEESDDGLSISSADDDETSDPTKLAALQRLIANLPQTEQPNRAPAKQRMGGASEYNTPSDFGLVSKTKLTMEDLGLPGVRDPHIKKSMKFLESESDGRAKNGVSKKLEVPLARRQQDRLDRRAAYEKTKETLDRWTDTVKHNRRADHLNFPLPDQDIASAHANNRLQPASASKPFNNLEATIQGILEESGLATINGKDDEDHIREFEELKAQKMSIEEVKARRNNLRMARDLLFREEAKAKRIKKIKSKSYRRVHRKQREREERKNKEALLQDGIEPSEDELEAQDRRRAAERMGAKHRNSKWAKETKQTGRAAWDEEARAGISEMARRDEELRKRVEGRAVRRENEDDSDITSSDSDQGSEDEEVAEQRRLLRQLNRVSKLDSVDDSIPGSKLSNMKFMLNAEVARKKENDKMAEDLRRELAGQETVSEEEVVRDIGRRLFGPGSNQATATQRPKVNEFEEPLSSDDGGDNTGLQIQDLDNGPEGSKIISKPGRNTKSLAWSKVASKSASLSNMASHKSQIKSKRSTEAEILDLSANALELAAKSTKRSKQRNPSALEVDPGSDTDDNNAAGHPFAIQGLELLKETFAGADVVAEFEAEKRQTIEDEDEKVIDNTLPGWGSWVGQGLSKKEKARNKGRFLTKTEGIKEQNRKDAKLERVIINEKRVKKVSNPE